MVEEKKCRVCGQTAEYRAVDRTFQKMAPYLCGECMDDIKGPGWEKFYKKIEYEMRGVR